MYPPLAETLEEFLVLDVANVDIGFLRFFLAASFALFGFLFLAVHHSESYPLFQSHECCGIEALHRNLLQYCHLDVVNHIDVCNSIVEAFLHHSAVAFGNGAAEQVAEHICDGIQEVGGAACHTFAELRGM